MDTTASRVPRLRGWPIGAVLLALALAACGGEPPPAAAPDEPAATVADAPPPAVPAFEVASVPLSAGPAGSFPYFGLPPGYRHARGRRQAVADGRFPFWIGDRFAWIEGRLERTAVVGAEGARFNDFALVRALDAMVADAGGVRVSAGRVPDVERDALWRDAARDVRDAQGDLRHCDATTWLVRSADRDLWLHLCSARNGAAMVIAESAPGDAADLAEPVD